MEIIKDLNNISGLLSTLITFVLVCITFWYSFITRKILKTSNSSNRMNLIIDVIYKQIKFEKELMNVSKFTCEITESKSIFEIVNSYQFNSYTEKNSSYIESEMVIEIDGKKEFKLIFNTLLNQSFNGITNFIYAMNSSLDIIKSLLVNSNFLAKNDINDLSCIYIANFNNDYIIFCNHLLSFLESKDGHNYKENNESDFRFLLNLLKFHTSSYNYIYNFIYQKSIAQNTIIDSINDIVENARLRKNLFSRPLIITAVILKYFYNKYHKKYISNINKNA